MPKIMDRILTIVSILGFWAIILGTFGGPVPQILGAPGNVYAKKYYKHHFEAYLRYTKYYVRTMAPYRVLGIAST